MKKLLLYWKPILVALIIFYGSLTSPSNIDKVSFFHFKNSDKLIHYIMYFILSLTFLISLIKHSSYIKKNSIVINLIFVISYGLLMEVLQYYFTQDRSADLFDAFANTFGAISGILILPLIEKLNLIKYL